MNIKVGKAAIEEASKKLSNWGRWGKDDQRGLLKETLVVAIGVLGTAVCRLLGPGFGTAATTGTVARRPESRRGASAPSPTARAPAPGSRATRSRCAARAPTT